MNKTVKQLRKEISDYKKINCKKIPRNKKELQNYFNFRQINNELIDAFSNVLDEYEKLKKIPEQRNMITYEPQSSQLILESNLIKNEKLSIQKELMKKIRSLDKQIIQINEILKNPSKIPDNERIDLQDKINNIKFELYNLQNLDKYNQMLIEVDKQLTKEKISKSDIKFDYSDIMKKINKKKINKKSMKKKRKYQKKILKK